MSTVKTERVASPPTQNSTQRISSDPDLGVTERITGDITLNVTKRISDYVLPPGSFLLLNCDPESPLLLQSGGLMELANG